MSDDWLRRKSAETSLDQLRRVAQELSLDGDPASMIKLLGNVQGALVSLRTYAKHRLPEG